jgi:WD40 repeat protein
VNGVWGRLLAATCVRLGTWSMPAAQALAPPGRTTPVTPTQPPPRCGRPITAVAFEPGGVLLATASADETVRIWDAVTPTPGAADPPPPSAPPPGPHPHFENEGVPGGQPRPGAGARAPTAPPEPPTGVGLLAQLEGHCGDVTSLAWAPQRPATGVSDGGPGGPPAHVEPGALATGAVALATGGADGSVRLWAVGPRRAWVQVAALATHGTGPVRSLSFSADGKLVRACRGVCSGWAAPACAIWGAASCSPSLVGRAVA